MIGIDAGRTVRDPVDGNVKISNLRTYEKRVQSVKVRRNLH